MVVPESDSWLAYQCVQDARARGSAILAIDIAWVEVTNVIWKQRLRRVATLLQTIKMFHDLQVLQIDFMETMPLPSRGFELAIAHGIAV